jgi:hypothetical protein
MTQGIVTIAQNNSTVDYVRLAYLQCLSLKLTNPGVPYALITDQQSIHSVSGCMKTVFDHVIELPVDLAQDQEWKQRNESQLFRLTPFTETIKVESDLLFTGSIAHWWHGLRKRDVVISTGCVDYRGQTATSRAYRKLFDNNHLPDVYTGLMYWRRSATAHELFNIAATLYANWETVKQQLMMMDKNDSGSNDMVFALAANIMGPERVTLPLEHFRMMHFKPAMNGLNDSLPCHEQMIVETHAPVVRIHGYQQRYPMHYHSKDWPTDQLISEYENGLG